MSSLRAERRQPEERRQQIIDTALELADLVGLDRLTSRDIAASLGIAKGLVHHYFATMDDLVVAVFEQFASNELAELASKLDALEPLPALRTYVSRALLVSGPAARLWMGAWVAAPRRPDLANVVDVQMHAGVDLLTALLTRGAEEGAFQLADPSVAACRILALLDGFLVQVSMRAAKSYGDVDSMVRDAVEREAGLAPGSLAIAKTTSRRRRQPI